jgi:hypothetical protein
LRLGGEDQRAHASTTREANLSDLPLYPLLDYVDRPVPKIAAALLPDAGEPCCCNGVIGWLEVSGQGASTYKGEKAPILAPLAFARDRPTGFASASPTAQMGSADGSGKATARGSRAAAHAGQAELAGGPMSRPGQSGEGKHDTQGTDKDHRSSETANRRAPRNDAHRRHFTPLLTAHPTNHASTNDTARSKGKAPPCQPIPEAGS